MRSGASSVGIRVKRSGGEVMEGKDEGVIGGSQIYYLCDIRQMCRA